MPRGRPKHDDVLTPREWQVLDLLREGLSNEAIGARLGISRQTVKFHVSEVLTKLGVSTRQEAARWPGRPRQRGFWLAWSRRASVPATAAALVLLLILVVVVVRWPAWGHHHGSESGAGQDAEQAGIGLDEAPPLALTTPVPVGLAVCADNDTWQKPTVDQQIAQMSAVDPQAVIYGGFGDMHRSQFAASFWFPPIGASPEGLVVEFSGLWTVPEGERAWYSGCQIPAGADGMDYRYVWLLNYEVVGASYAGDGVVVQVERKPAGFQVVRLHLEDAVLYDGPVSLVDASGTVIERANVSFPIPGAGPDCTCLAPWSVKP